MLPAVDLFLFDMKETDPANHLRYTRVKNDLPLENIRKLDALGVPIIVRCPIIPGVNDRPAHFEALATLYASLSHVQGIQLMPYHRLGQGKTTRFGAQSQDFRMPEPAEIASWNQMLQNAIHRYKAERWQ